MRSPGNDDIEAQLAALEQYLDELDRKTRSNLSVTNPVTGIKNLEVNQTDGVTLRDDNGNIIFGANVSQWGFKAPRMPMPVYPTQVASGLLFADTTTWVTFWQTSTFVNAPVLQLAYRYKDFSPSGGTSQCRVVYNVGAGDVIITDSIDSFINPTNQQKYAEFTWPTDIYDTEVNIYLQGRMSAGTGNMAVSPVFFLGGEG